MHTDGDFEIAERGDPVQKSEPLKKEKEAETEAEAEAGPEKEEAEPHDEEEADEDEDDEDEDEGDEEPKLKYQRLGGDVTQIFTDDTASCLIAHEKFLVLGTHKGYMHVLDLNGHKIMSLKVHNQQINGLSLDASGDFVASCSDDGTVAVTNLYTHDHKRLKYSRPVKSVALPLAYNYKPREMLACGGLTNQLILTRKDRLFTFKDETVIHSGEGPIHAIAWRTDLIAWGNDLGVKIYDHTRDERMSYVQRDKDAPAPELYRCHLCWATDDTLIIGWGNSVQVGSVKEKKKAGGASARVLQIIALFNTEYYICGIAPFGEYLVILAYIEEDALSDDEDETEKGKGKKPKAIKKEKSSTEVDGKQKEKKAQRPELRVVTWTNQDVSSDALPIKGFESYRALDYRLDYLPGVEALFYIVSPHDIVVARPRDVDDHIQWLMEHEKYQDALKVAQNNPQVLRKHKVLDIGEKFLHHYMENGEYKKAAAALPKLLEENAALWETWIMAFAMKRQIAAIGPYIPTQKPLLRQHLYEMVLNYFLDEDHEGFLRTIKEWPLELYKMEHVITALQDRLKQSDSRILTEALGHLYLINKQPQKAVHVYLTLKRPDVFKLISDLELFEAIQDKLLQLITFDKTQAISLFINNIEKVPVDSVVRQLQHHPQLQHEYLHALFKKDATRGTDHHGLQVRLYAEFDSKSLLPFLRNSNSYTLEDALHVCKEKNLYQEQVFLLKRMGNTNYALKLIIEQIKDVKQAIDFVEEHKDPQLWEELIQRSLQNSKFLSDLLEHAGSHYVDLLKLIQRIPDGLDIPELKDKLVKIFSDCALQKHVMQGCNNILQNDCVNLQTRLHRRQQRAVKIGPSMGLGHAIGGPGFGLELDDEDGGTGGVNCALCNGDLFQGKLESVVIFFCRHVYHQTCFELQRVSKRQRLECIVCSKRRRVGQTSSTLSSSPPASLSTLSASSTASSVTSSSSGSGSGSSGVVSGVGIGTVSRSDPVTSRKIAE